MSSDPLDFSFHCYRLEKARNRFRGAKRARDFVPDLQVCVVSYLFGDLSGIDLQPYEACRYTHRLKMITNATVDY